MSTPFAPPTPPSPPPPPTAPVPRNRKPLYLVVAVAVVVVVILVAFVLLPSLTSSGSGASGPLTYSGARPVADSTMSGYQGGGWTLLFAGGLAPSVGEPFPANTSALGNLSSSGCTYNLVANVNSLSLPAFTGNRSSGEAPAWEFGYRNSTDTIGIAAVINGKGTVLATITGSECAFVAQVFNAVPGNVIDSSQAAADVAPDAAGFLAAHANVSTAFLLLGGISFLGKTTPAEWSVVYSTCALVESGGGTGAQFNATVNAITGAVSGVQENPSATCGGNITVATPVPGTPTSAAIATGAGVLARSESTA